MVGQREIMITGQETASLTCAPVIDSFVVNVMCQSDSSTETASESDQFEFSTDTANDSEDYDKSTDTASEADNAPF